MDPKNKSQIIIFLVNTHMHADHITGTGRLKKLLPEVKSGIAESSGAKADFHFKDGEKIKFGNHELEVRFTPGHTNGERPKLKVTIKNLKTEYCLKMWLISWQEETINFLVIFNLIKKLFVLMIN